MKAEGPGSGRSPQSAVRSAGIILAAGAGTRLGELGQRYSKPMVPLAGRPLIDWVITRLGAAGVERVVVVNHSADRQLADLLSRTHANVRRVEQSERRGIADALRRALPMVADEPGYLACACDSLFDAHDIARLVTVGQQDADSAVVGVLEMGASATVSRSAVRLDGERVREIIEKPPHGADVSGVVAMPLYWLPRCAAAFIENVAPLGNEAYVSTALNDFIRAGGTVRAVHVRGRIEITTAEDVARAAAQLQTPEP